MFMLLLIVSLTFQSYKLFVVVWELIFFFFFPICLFFPTKALSPDGLNVPIRKCFNGRRMVDVVLCRVQLYSPLWKIEHCFCLKPHVQNT